MFSRYDFLIWIGIAVLALGGIFYSEQMSAHSGEEVQITVNSEEYGVFSLREDRLLEVEGVNGITEVEISDGRVRVIHSACPDKICIYTGWVHRPNQTIVCLPNRVVVKIISEAQQDIDLYTN
ncbi:MAG: NusG domain II-containing protein [Candidatus Syntrophonatronum acetioxidans]|uniref:NusG domain II-containing protein n=1 Tax=Candidatus Syntrophonatronum acetioxidans TaxID=1795816 RepID=A0A424YAZ1_9FIRM|nr:MAG: NusG domain II-containing protein [Candidatus Syntrophonatronum acetioxidans]